MSAIVPRSRPQMNRHAAVALLTAHGADTTHPVLLGRRGYYLDTMGKRGVNDRSIYDDAIILVSPTAYVTFNANCDPSRFGAGIAVLEPGLWRFRIGTHGVSRPKAEQYRALIQAVPVVVRRDGTEAVEKGTRHPDYGKCLGDGKWTDAPTPRFMTNIHRGGRSTTSSLGCQTIHPDQWDGALAIIESEMRRYGTVTIDYLLTEEPTR